MKLKKKKKSKRMRGLRTHGHSAKLNKGKGSHGGKGMAGTGKRADQKKTLVTKLYGNKYFGKQGITSRKTAKKRTNVINLEDIGKKFSAGEINLEKYKILGEGEIKGKVRVRLTKESVSASFEIIEFSESKVDIDKSKITETLNASEVEKTVFKIKNDNAVELRNVEIVIDITNANYVEKEKALTWFSVSPPGYFTIPAKEGSTKGETSAEIVIAPKAIDLDIPAEAKEATISGNVIVKSTYMEKTIRFDYTINKSEIEISIEKMDDEYTAQYDDVRLKYTANDEIEFKNDGDVSLKRIEVREFQCKDNINEKYQKTEDIGVLTDYWEEIRPTEKKTTKLAIALSSVHAADKTFFCKMIVSHDNPFFVPGEGLDDVIFTEKEFIVITAR